MPPPILPSPTQSWACPGSAPNFYLEFPQQPLFITPSHLHVHSHLLQTTLQAALYLEPSPGTYCLQDASQLLHGKCKALCDLASASSASLLDICFLTDGWSAYYVLGTVLGAGFDGKITV